MLHMSFDRLHLYISINAIPSNIVIIIKTQILTDLTKSKNLNNYENKKNLDIPFSNINIYDKLS